MFRIRSRGHILAGVAFVCLVIGPVACRRQAAPPHARNAPAPESPTPTTANPRSDEPSPLPDFAVNAASVRTGEASWYAVPENSLPERRAWAGEMTAASDVLPLNTYARVHRLDGEEQNKSVIVRITDRGVHEKGTLVDLNKEAAEALGMLKAGKVRVRLEVLALKNADADKPVETKNLPKGPTLDQPAASKDDEKQAAKAKTGE